MNRSSVRQQLSVRFLKFDRSSLGDGGASKGRICVLYHQMGGISGPYKNGREPLILQGLHVIHIYCCQQVANWPTKLVWNRENFLLESVPGRMRRDPSWRWMAEQGQHLSDWTVSRRGPLVSRPTAATSRCDIGFYRRKVGATAPSPTFFTSWENYSWVECSW